MNSSNLISREICETEKSENIHTVSIEWYDGIFIKMISKLLTKYWRLFWLKLISRKICVVTENSYGGIWQYYIARVRYLFTNWRPPFLMEWKRFDESFCLQIEWCSYLSMFKTSTVQACLTLSIVIIFPHAIWVSNERSRLGKDNKSNIIFKNTFILLLAINAIYQKLLSHFIRALDLHITMACFKFFFFFFAFLWIFLEGFWFFWKFFIVFVRISFSKKNIL